MKTRILFLLCSLVLCLCIALPSDSNTLPTRQDVEQMTEQAAAEALQPYRRGQILESWGAPAHTMDALSSTLVDCYDAPTRGGWICVGYRIHSTPGDSVSDVAQDFPVSWVRFQTVTP